jgi:outer membrane protein OmpA-like peptidoglycan-associated protein
MTAAALALVALVAAAVWAGSSGPADVRTTSPGLRLDAEADQLRSRVHGLDSPRYPLRQRPARLRSSDGVLRSAAGYARSSRFRLVSPSDEPRPRPGRPITILFAFGSDRVTADANELRDRVRKLFDGNAPSDTSLLLDVSGHADRIGTLRHNEALSARRARAVTRILVGAGFRLRTWAYGETCPAAAPSLGPGGQDLPDARRQNRRVVVSIAHDGRPDRAQHCLGRAPTAIRIRPSGRAVAPHR